jgi:hypothetical protein
MEEAIIVKVGIYKVRNGWFCTVCDTRADG